ncbi:G patch domain-containing protein 11-like [Ruditapes philippinarum]|uniref:G patch domain-containing protein 11-like n=1 Tax=Ruditapes philippinarum TaxID=129788 RepID=UPI00295C1E88|nr:G patch domain-containing protein 11-like [Ruditapes philippinarum]
MSDEEDYMSDAFLQKLPDTRPGLLSKDCVRRQEQRKKEKQYNEKNKQKPKAVLEREKREEGLGASLSSDNKGFSLLQKMGYKPGMAIGKSGVGRTEPIPVEVKLGRGGLGREADQKRKKDQQVQMHKHWSAKRRKMEAEHKQTFMRRMNERIKNKNVDKDLYKSQKVCEQLDSQMGITQPHEAFFWPEALLPRQAEEDDDDINGVGEDERLDRMQPGYSGYVQDDVDDDDDNDDDNDDDDSRETEEEPAASYSVEEMLDVLTIYLRTKHKYCVWCGTKYNDKEDLMKHCPGNSAELHEDM